MKTTVVETLSFLLFNFEPSLGLPSIGFSINLLIYLHVAHISCVSIYSYITVPEPITNVTFNSYR